MPDIFQKIAAVEKVHRLIFLAATVILGIFILVPMADFQPVISPGDHGHDLYSFEMTLKGKIPYRDFWWVYGPLMPYYYALFLKIFGVHIQSVIFGKLLLVLLSGIFFYKALAHIIRPSFAFMATVWFYTFSHDFFFTFNHVGGIACLMGIMCLFAKYFCYRNPRHLYGILFLTFVLSMIKLNFGLFALLACVLVVTIETSFRNRTFSLPGARFLITALLFLPVVIFLVYFLFLRDLPVYAIRQCMPYLSADHPYRADPLVALSVFSKSIWMNMNANIHNRIFAFLIVCSIVQTTVYLFSKKTKPEARRVLLLFIATAAVFYVLNLHEFLASGLYYRTFWAKPFSIMLMFVVLSVATRPLHRIFRFVFHATVFLIVSLHIINNIQQTNMVKTPDHFFRLSRARIYTGNPPIWQRDVEDTVHFLLQNLKKDEKFFALPYDPLYYFLTGRESPTRQLIFFEHINIPEVQEKKIIRELEEHNINWVVLSSRHLSPEAGLGLLGQTYCPLIGQYLNDNFTILRRFGDWQNPAAWAWPHGVKILKRK